MVICWFTSCTVYLIDTLKLGEQTFITMEEESKFVQMGVHIPIY